MWPGLGMDAEWEGDGERWKYAPVLYPLLNCLIIIIICDKFGIANCDSHGETWRWQWPTARNRWQTERRVIYDFRMTSAANDSILGTQHTHKNMYCRITANDYVGTLEMESVDITESTITHVPNAINVTGEKIWRQRRKQKKKIS